MYTCIYCSSHVINWYLLPKKGGGKGYPTSRDPATTRSYDGFVKIHSSLGEFYRKKIIQIVIVQL